MKRSLLCGAGLVTLCLTAHTWHKEPRRAPMPDERLLLSTPRQEYLLGEPVLFELRLRNIGKEPIKVVQLTVTPDQYEAPLWISRNDEPFREFTPNVEIDKVLKRRVIPLGTGESLEYSYRVVGAPKNSLERAFPVATEYQVYADFPLYLAGAPRSVQIASNVVKVHVKDPIGEDAKVWEELNHAAFLSLLQVEHPYGKPDVPMKMAKILRSYPTSGYAPALRHALSKVYFHHRLDLPEADQELLAISLGINRVEALSDDRLQARRMGVFDKDTPFAEVLKAFSALGVPLDAAPELLNKKVSLPDAYGSIRLAMRWLSDELEASWERRGKGYLLVPFDASKPKPLRVKGSN